MQNKQKVSNIEEVLGYQFKNSSLIKSALIHSSYSNERGMKKGDNNERLEFLGDAVLELVTSDYIYFTHKDLSEGDLTKLRASMVCEQSLSYCAKKLSIGEFLFLGKGEEATGGRSRDSILSDALEAIIGAIYIDGGFTNAKEFIEKNILKNIEKNQLFFDSKTILQEFVQGEFKSDVSYVLISEEGPDHNKIFSVTAIVDGKEIGIGKGRTKKAAEQEAAYQALLKYQKRYNKLEENR